MAAVIHGAAGFPIRRKINREQWLWLRRAQLVDVLDAIYIFGVYGLSGGRSASRLWGAHRSAADMQALLREAADVLCDWPEGFNRFLDRMRSGRGTEAKTGIISEFGDFYSALHRRFAKRRLGFLQNAFQEYLARNWNGGYAKPQARWARPSGSMAFVGRPEVARILGISAQTVDVLLREGELEGETQPMGKSRSFAVVTRRSLNDYQKRRRYIVESEQAAQLLGISRETYRGMVNAGIINANRERVTHRPRKAFEVDRRLIDGLLSRLEQQAASGFIGVVVDYKTAIERFSRKHKGNVGLIRATLGKQITVGAIDRDEVGLRRLRFDEKSLSDFLSSTTKTDRAVLDPVRESMTVIINPPFKSGG
jgi:predicted DNA-binding transcriptional regulator AlpA